MKLDGAGEDKLDEFKTKIQKWVSDLVKKDRFKNLSFYSGKLVNQLRIVSCGENFCTLAGAGESAADGGLGILEYRTNDAGEETPVMMFIRVGLVEEKCVSVDQLKMRRSRQSLDILLQ